LLVNIEPFGITNIKSSGNNIILFGPLDICLRLREFLKENIFLNFYFFFQFISTYRITKKAVSAATDARRTPKNEKRTIRSIRQP
jgi:hypothetical protein